MNILFDLDGTLIDSRPRLYHLFQELVPVSDFSFDEYWTRKRSKLSHDKILRKEFGFQDSEIKLFQKNWMNLIENDYWLSYDKPYKGVDEFLTSISSHNLYVVTARQSVSKAVQQLAAFGWNKIFSDILVTEQKFEKHELISRRISLSASDWLIGDTGKDIQTGKKLQIRTGAVLSGFLDRKSLLEYLPDQIENNVTDFKFSSLQNG